ncbi:MAG: type II toxin-antitoxin system Phd/YefM family antitoxin [Pseudohongiella sp.]|nr:type II toxin-antitoxin system Phd/YefM family antitoxin [Pseudohongiella sp.]
MNIYNATEACSQLCSLMDEAATTHKPILITGELGNVILVAEEDWKAMNETLFLVSIPGMRESIRENLDYGLEETTTKLDW